VLGLLVIGAIIVSVSGGMEAVPEEQATGMLIRPTFSPTELVETEEATEVAETSPETAEPAGPKEETPAPTETAEEETPVPTATALILPDKDGALIAVQMESRVGVVLNGYPEASQERIAQALIDAPESHWTELARNQVRYTMHRLNFRNFVYPGKGQLPLPPQELWQFEFDPNGPAVEEIGDLKVVVVDFTFHSTLLTDDASPGIAEPQLAEADGIWEEPYILPMDPDYLFQRTDNACLNESGFPPNSYDAENAWIFFDHTCVAQSGGPGGCHRLQLPQEDCIDAMERATGTVETQMAFRRLAWDDDLADDVRVGEVTQLDAPDLAVISDDLQDYRVIYRYFPPDSCGLVEGCVGGSGWRRLLQFKATVHNLGAEALSVGPVASNNPLANFFQYNSCHDHFHFQGYGEFSLDDASDAISSKQAFCVESTNRYSNNEFSPLTHSFTCLNQGVQAGWVDEYVAGLDCQWIDITDFEIPEEQTIDLGFVFNPDQFICEGMIIRDENGNPAFEPSGLLTENGQPIQRPQCEFVNNYFDNNVGSAEIFVAPTGGFVTEPCNSSYLGPLRNCGFTEVPQPVVETAESGGTSTPLATEAAQPVTPELFSCTPGEPVLLTCSVPPAARPQVLRICEYSQILGVGVACVFSDAMVNWVVTDRPVQLGFTCPFLRDENEMGGRYSFYTAPAFSEDAAAEVSCTLR
ncbi:MAG: lysyl oxidase family protein, partial [Candidatus Promineifilaceae bacterium]